MSGRKGQSHLFMYSANCIVISVTGDKVEYLHGFTEKNIDKLVDTVTGLGYHVTLHRLGNEAIPEGKARMEFFAHKDVPL